MKMHGFKFVVMILAALAGFSLIVMLLWNALLPGIFGVVSINFWQAAGLLVLSRILFSGMGRGKFFGHHGGMRGGRNAIREKWMKMTPEERKEFISKHKRHRRDFSWMESEGPFDTRQDSPERKD